MTWFIYITMAFLPVIIILLVPYIVFVSVGVLFNYHIPYNWKTVLSFWALYIVFKMTTSIKKSNKFTFKGENINNEKIEEYEIKF
jgi:hypothetical protein